MYKLRKTACIKKYETIEICIYCYLGFGIPGECNFNKLIEWSFLQQNFIQIFNPLLHLQVFGLLLSARLFWIFLTMAVCGFYAVRIIDGYLAQPAEKAEFHAAKAVYQSSQKFQERKPSSSLPSVRSEQTYSYVPQNKTPQTFTKPATKVEKIEVESPVKLLEWAIQSSQKIRFSYETRDGKKSDGTLTPINFKTFEQTLCLESYCHLRKAKRSFAVKRMQDIKIICATQANYQQETSDEVITKPEVEKKLSRASLSPSAEVIQKNNYQQETSHEVITTPEVEKKLSRASLSPSAEVIQKNNTKAQVKQRPYLKYRTNELERIADEKWDDTKVLNQIDYELEFRSRKKALDLRKRIASRLTQLHETQFAYPTTKANSGSQDLSNEVFKYSRGLLKHYGYKVGRSGLSQKERWRILDRVFSQPLLQIDNAAYLNEWGEPLSAKRLQKMVDSIAAFTRNAGATQQKQF